MQHCNLYIFHFPIMRNISISSVLDVLNFGNFAQISKIVCVCFFINILVTSSLSPGVLGDNQLVICQHQKMYLKWWDMLLILIYKRHNI